MHVNLTMKYSLALALSVVCCGCDMTNIPDPKEKSKQTAAGLPTSNSNDSSPNIGDSNTSAPVHSPPAQPNASIVQPASSEDPSRSIIVNRPFMTITANNTTVPTEIIGHLEDIDTALQDLLVAGQTNLIEKDVYQQSLARLTELKLNAAQRLSASQDAAAEQQKAGALAQLEALSHKSGMLQDVDSARKLEEFAEQLSQSQDSDLKHQGQVVLLGFELQSLENGISKGPEKLLERTRELFQGSGERNFPGFMMLQRIVQACQQLGFGDAASEIEQLIASEYQDSDDALLRGEAWKFAVRNSQALQNFNVSLGSLGTSQFESTAVLAAARGLYEAFPTEATLEQLSALIGNLEYGGQQLLSTQLADFVSQKLSGEDSAAQTNAKTFIREHRARTSLVGTKLDLSSLVTFTGQPFDASNYAGKVVLIDFWATWCVPCMQEVPNLLEAHKQLADQGFDILAVNMDEDIEQATNTIQTKNYPWTNYRFSDAAGFESAFAKQNGINMIPFMVLVGKDGSIKKLHVRGVDIVPSIREELGLATDIIPDEIDIDN